MKVLVIGQSQGLSQAAASVLKVRWPDLTLVQASETREDLELMHREQPDIVMFHFPELSEGASSGDDFDLITRIRSFSDVPIIVISQSDNVMDKVKALEMGADDWVSPSFVPMEFIAKVNAILRRFPSNRGAFLSLDGKLSINYATHQVCVSGKPVKLTPIQYRLLCHLVRNQGRVCSSAELLQHVWGPNYGGERELLKLSVYRLRSKIEEDPSSPEIILNERGVGYVIRAPASSASSSQ
jgi:two-component system KDP operon response regulator KdpE